MSSEGQGQRFIYIIHSDTRSCHNRVSIHLHNQQVIHYNQSFPPLYLSLFLSFPLSLTPLVSFFSPSLPLCLSLTSSQPCRLFLCYSSLSLSFSLPLSISQSIYISLFISLFLSNYASLCSICVFLSLSFSLNLYLSRLCFW